MLPPDDMHEWVSFEDIEEDRTWVFDLTFLTSAWTCIFGRGCQGVFIEPEPELQHGCCSYGAHFVDAADVDNALLHIGRLSADQWQFKAVADAQGGPVTVNDDGDQVTIVHEDACIMLNRPGFPAGAGCALHQAAVDAGERFMDWKPTVCWQLPLRCHDETDSHGHVTSTLREWKRRDWGAGGHEFGWWCTSDDDAFVGQHPVYVELRDEIIEMTNEWAYEQLVGYVEARRARNAVEVFLPHPAVRRP